MSTSSALPKPKPLDPANRAILQQGADALTMGLYEKAKTFFETVLKDDPYQPDALHLLGVLYKNIQQFELSERYFLTSIQISPNFSAAHYNLGNLYYLIGAKDEARQCFLKSIELSPNYADAFNNLGNIAKEEGNAGEAINRFARAAILDPKNSLYWQNLHEVVSLGTIITKANEELSRALVWALENKHIEWRSILNIAMQLMNATPEIRQNYDWLQQGILDDKIRDGTAFAGFNHWLFIGIMPFILLPSPPTEYKLRQLRTTLLDLADTGALPSACLFPNDKVFSMLAQQCYTNEYVYSVSETESLQLERLWNKVGAMSTFTNADKALVALCASYRRLGGLPNADAVETFARQSGDSLFEDLVVSQITEPRIEAALKAEIPTLMPIEDAISQKVQAQYEEHPYPRWRFRPHIIPRNFQQIIRAMYDYAPQEWFKGFETPKILVAGCGTGRHPIWTATQAINSQVLAVDLSKASLAYAMRKARELGITNLEFLHADILTLTSLGRQFDSVECSGVLHHMSDPVAGWSVLTKLLRPGGFMKIALYSKYAREQITEARQMIASMGFEPTDTDIRRFRDQIMRGPNTEMKQRLTAWTDFFSLSECRDLLFHAQEHVMTIPQLRDIIRDQGLEFLGFHFDKLVAKNQFAKDYPDDPLQVNLDYWDEFERKNPGTFAAMYQFWLRKPE